MPRAAPVACLLAAALFLGSCFEPPVLELLTLSFAAEGGAVASLEVALAAPGELEARAVTRRIEERERALLEGSDPWLDRFAALAAAEDGAEWRRGGGRLRSFRRWARVDSGEALAGLVQGDAAHFGFSSDGERATLELVPLDVSRATRKERLRVARELEAWSAVYTRYLAAAYALDAYLEARPERATTCWGAVLGEPEGQSPLEEEESRLVETLAELMAEALTALEVDPLEGYSLDERARRVFHPFEARIGVELPVEPNEVAGFVRADERAFVVPELSLSEATARLEGRWLAADPLLAMASALRLGQERVADLTPFTRSPIVRSVSPPDADEVADALRLELSPPPVYRLVWRTTAMPAAPGAAL